ncbi:MAG: hypothetical protein GC146_09210 [Limimaricola sp.]|uniref:hypothetical protein n=1 Tax=Limimaricola sp. TaxID=2211665 RepID=UPI001D3B8152|nr:hypothetical protein [Limimaricola sp.]MBI1417388.1 hypothetical protein [Limimaricola sp.]
MHRRTFLIGMPLALAGCGAQHVWAPDEAVARAFYHFDGPPSLTLFTMKNVGSGNGAHSSLMINASQRVIFDPAGSFSVPEIPERDDVLFGITPRIEQYYISYHSRITYYTVSQEIDVSPEVAEMALQLALANGPVAKAHCTLATSGILKRLPGFESIHSTWFPDNLEKQLARFPGVVTHEYRETDSDDKSIALRQIERALQTGNGNGPGGPQGAAAGQPG